jgi:hypothetical protein
MENNMKMRLFALAFCADLLLQSPAYSHGYEDTTVWMDERSFDKAMSSLADEYGGNNPHDGGGFIRRENNIIVPRINDSQIRKLLSGNTLRVSDYHYAAYFDAKGTISGWEQDWLEADMSRCPTPDGEDHVVVKDKCLYAPRQSLDGIQWYVESGKLCFSKAILHLSDRDTCVFVSIIGDKVVMFRQDGGQVRWGNDLFVGKELASDKPKKK